MASHKNSQTPFFESSKRILIRDVIAQICDRSCLWNLIDNQSNGIAFVAPSTQLKAAIEAQKLQACVRSIWLEHSSDFVFCCLKSGCYAVGGMDSTPMYADGIVLLFKTKVWMRRRDAGENLCPRLRKCLSLLRTKLLLLDCAIRIASLRPMQTPDLRSALHAQTSCHVSGWPA